MPGCLGATLVLAAGFYGDLGAFLFAVMLNLCWVSLHIDWTQI